MALVDVSLLSTNLKESKLDYEKIFGLMLKDGFAPIPGVTRLPIKQKVELMRKVNSPITQPGRTGAPGNREKGSRRHQGPFDLLETRGTAQSPPAGIACVRQDRIRNSIDSIGPKIYPLFTDGSQIVAHDPGHEDFTDRPAEDPAILRSREPCRS